MVGERCEQRGAERPVESVVERRSRRRVGRSCGPAGSVRAAGMAPGIVSISSLGKEYDPLGGARRCIALLERTGELHLVLGITGRSPHVDLDVGSPRLGRQNPSSRRRDARSDGRCRVRLRLRLRLRLPRSRVRERSRDRYDERSTVNGSTTKDSATRCPGRSIFSTRASVCSIVPIMMMRSRVSDQFST